MQKNIKNVSETEQELEIILSAEEFGTEYNQELEEAKRSIQIKGFRKGHAPASLIKKLAGPSIEATIAEKMASKYFGEIAEAENIKPASRAQLINVNFEPEQLTLRLSYEIHPAFELKDFSDYSFTKARYPVTDKDVEHEINMILKSRGTLISVDEAALSTDTVIGNVYKLDEAGEPLEEEKTENHHFTLEYLPEENPFRKALTGKKAGEVVDIENDQKDSTAEPSRYRVNISEIKRLELPELTDDLVKEITGDRFESVADFTADVHIQIEQHFLLKSEEDLLESISAKLIDEEQFSQSMRPNAIRHAQWLLISKKIAELDNLEVSDDDIKAYAEKEADKNGAGNAEDLLNTYMSSEFRDYITDTILKDKIYDLIKSTVTITEEERPIPLHKA